MDETMKTMTVIETRLEAARKVLAATGKNPRQIGDESRQRIIEWLYLWGYTSATLVQQILGRTSAGYARKLAKQGWLAATKTASGIPVAIFTLTEQGLSEAERHAVTLYRYPEIDPYKVIQQQIRHYMIAQNATLNGLKAGTIAHFETERMFSQTGDKSGIKRPDAVWHTNAGLRIAVEIELSAKWARDLDEFVLGIARELQTTKEKAPTYHRFAIISDSKAIIDRYQAAMQPGMDLHLWTKNQRNHWVVDKTIKIPVWLINLVDFRLIGK